MPVPASSTSDGRPGRRGPGPRTTCCRRSGRTGRPGWGPSRGRPAGGPAPPRPACSRAGGPGDSSCSWSRSMAPWRPRPPPGQSVTATRVEVRVPRPPCRPAHRGRPPGRTRPAARRPCPPGPRRRGPGRRRCPPVALPHQARRRPTPCGTWAWTPGPSCWADRDRSRAVSTAVTSAGESSSPHGVCRPNDLRYQSLKSVRPDLAARRPSPS